jgi:CDP-glycerol glycerophosphotransferase
MSDHWIFGMDDGGGTKFSGNSWYFLKYIVENHPNIKVLCITSHEETIDVLKSYRINYAKPNTFKAIVAALTYKVNIICGELRHEIPNFSKRKSIKINLWHGVPLKKIYYLSPKMMDRHVNRSFKIKFLEILQGVIKNEEYDAIIYTSDKIKKIMEQSFRNSNVYLTGQPRDDIFYEKTSRDKLLAEIGLERYKEKKIVVYLPTYRDTRNKKDNYFIFKENEEALKLLTDNNIVIFQKDHNTIVEETIENGPVQYLPDLIETQKLMMVADILITDYSSVFIDYLNLKRPMIFHCYDIENYMRNDRGLNFDYFDDLITAGPKTRNEKELLVQIIKYSLDETIDNSLRDLSLNFYQEYKDGKNSKRVYELIIGLIND